MSYNTWTQKTTFPNPIRHYAGVFSIGNYGYAGGGVNPSDVQLATFYRYNSLENIWTQLNNIGQGLQNFAIGFSVNGKGYFIHNYTNTWEYTPDLDSWTQVGTADYDIDYNMSYGKPLIYNGRVYFNINNTGVPPYPNAVAVFNYGTKSWEAYKTGVTSDVNRQHTATFGIDSVGKLWNGCGYKFLNQYIKYMYCYNPSNDSWSQTQDFSNTYTRYCVSTSIGKYGYVGLGWGGGTQDRSRYWAEYDPDLDTWTQMSDFGASPGIQNSSPFVIDKYAYLVFGSSAVGGTYNNDMWMFEGHDLPISMIRGFELTKKRKFSRNDNIRETV